MPRPRILVAFVGGQLLVVLLLGEILLRIWQPQAAGLSRMPTIYEPDPALGYRYRANATGRMQRYFDIDNEVIINSAGFHDEEQQPGPGERPILVVGDSFTASLQVPVAGTWTQLLQRRLRETDDPKLRVVNLGLDGTGTDIHLALLEENLARYGPKLVILAFYANDLADLAHGRVYREVRGDYVLLADSEEQAARMRVLADELQQHRLRRWFFEHSYLMRMIVYLGVGDHNLLRSNVIKPFHLGDGRPGRGGSSPSLQGVLREFVELAQSRGFSLLVVPVPMKGSPEASLRILRKRVSLPELEVVDVGPALRTELERSGETFDDLYWSRDGHFNPRGNELFCNAVADALMNRLPE